ncbi:MAG: hypothetical protein KAI64_02770, partial [Thermoplasmata archaeon]|nr:hypothetical protein [Thermoplasmata archaeon]
TGSGQATLTGGGLDGTYPLNGSMKFTKINDTTYQVTYTINVPSEGLSETLTDTMTYVGGVIFDSDGVSVGTASGNTISVNYSTTVEGVSGTLTASLQKQ